MLSFVLSMPRLSRTTGLLIYLVMILRLRQTYGGVCWKYQDTTTGLCRTAIVTNMTYEECCNLRGLPSVSWTSLDVSSNVFYISFLSKGSASCRRCHRTCESVSCFPGKKCRMIDGFPTCVCKPKCDPALKSRGTLCGVDGRTYKDHCHLLRENCKKDQRISVDYYGKCRGSCKRVRCEIGQHCMQDQNGTPHCVTCSQYCKKFIPEIQTNYLCGENGRTYRNTCDLKADMCKLGRTIRIAHFGSCKANETCASINCQSGSTCLRHPKNGRPVCANCNVQCQQSLTIPVCGTDKQTYQSYCHMVNYGCRTGYFIAAQRQGPCKSVRVELKAANLKLQGSTYETNINTRQNLLPDKKKKHRRHKDRHKRRKHRKYKRRQSRNRKDRQQKTKTSDHHINTKSRDNSKKKSKNRKSKRKDNKS